MIFSLTCGATTEIRLISSSQKNLSAILMILFTQLLAVEVESDSDIASHLFHTEQLHYGKELSDGIWSITVPFSGQLLAMLVYFRS